MNLLNKKNFRAPGSKRNGEDVTTNEHNGTTTMVSQFQLGWEPSPRENPAGRRRIIVGGTVLPNAATEKIGGFSKIFCKAQSTFENTEELHSIAIVRLSNAEGERKFSDTRKERSKEA